MDNNFLYSVYSITVDMIEDIYDGDSFDDAYEAWQNAVKLEKERRQAEGAKYLETTVYLYDAWCGIIYAEETILEGGTMTEGNVAQWRGTLWSDAEALVERMIYLGELAPAARDMSLEDVAWQYNEANALSPEDADYLHVLV